MGNREIGGVGLAFVGFAAIVLAFKGTWGNTWAALLGRPATSSPAGKPPPLSQGATNAPDNTRPGLPGTSVGTSTNPLGRAGRGSGS